MHKQATYTFWVFTVLFFSCILAVLTSCGEVVQGPPGPQGLTGATGEDGLSCGWAKVDGGVLITCTDGTTAVIYDREDGKKCDVANQGKGGHRND